MSSSQALAAEVAHLRRRYGRRVTLSVEQRLVTVELAAPPAGELPVPVGAMRLEARLPQEYPLTPAELSFCCVTLPPPILDAVNSVLERQFSLGRYTAEGQVKSAAAWLENHVGALLREIMALQQEAQAGQEEAPRAVPAVAPPAVASPAVAPPAVAPPAVAPPAVASPAVASVSPAPVSPAPIVDASAAVAPAAGTLPPAPAAPAAAATQPAPAPAAHAAAPGAEALAAAPHKWAALFSQPWSHAQQRALEVALREALALGAQADTLLALAGVAGAAVGGGSASGGGGGSGGATAFRSGGGGRRRGRAASHDDAAPPPPSLQQQQQPGAPAAAGDLLGGLLFSRSTWVRVAAAVGGGKSPEDCCARFLVCRRLAGDWRAASYAAARSRLAAEPEVHSRQHHAAAPPLPHSYASAREAGLVQPPPRRHHAHHGGGADGAVAARADALHVDYAADGGGAATAAASGSAANAFSLSSGWPQPPLAAGDARESDADVDVDEDEDEDEDEGSEDAEEGCDEIEGGDSQDEPRPPARGGLAAVDSGRGGQSAPTPEAPTDEVDEEDEATMLPAFAGLHLKPLHAGHALMLRGLSLYNIGTLAVSRLALNAMCTRCSTLITPTLRGVTLPAGGSGSSGGAPLAVAMLPPSLLEGAPAFSPACEYKGWCPGCSQLLSLYLRPTLVHEGSPCLGYVDASLATVAGVSDCSLFATCLECGGVADVKSFRVPGALELSCRVCFMRTRLGAREVEVVAATDASAAAAAAAAAAASGQQPRRAQRFQPGRPLPLNGACSHYKRSHRWLRFPCCARAHACDACHDEAEDHPFEWALRMLCGFCSREQPCVNGPCVACGAALGKGLGGGGQPRYWEGGSGQRNRALLSRSDPRKHAGLGKMRSAKAGRVGAAGKARREAAAAATKAAAAAGGGGGGGGGCGGE